MVNLTRTPGSTKQEVVNSPRLFTSCDRLGCSVETYSLARTWRLAVPICVLWTCEISNFRVNPARGVYLSRELQARQCFAQMRLKRTNHNKHECL
jgi:hypothetical protein